MAAGIMRLLGERRYYTIEVNFLHIFFVVSVILHINANLFSLVYLFIYIVIYIIIYIYLSLYLFIYLFII